MVDADMRRYYGRGGELTRLSAGIGRLEFLRTADVLRRTLPPAPARILDVGGATGVYARPLAAAGYQVHLIDPMPDHVAHASALPGVTAAVGAARELAEPDASVDAVLMLGPLYHLTDRADRVRAWREAARVVKPGGVVVAAVITRFAEIFDGFISGYADDDTFNRIVDVTMATGEHRNIAERTWFSTAYFHRPEEVEPEAVEAALHVERLLGVEGPMWLTGNTVDEWLTDEARTAHLLHRLRQIEAEPSLLGASSHLLAVARRPA
jgi:SAM-dependent methyltransferase